MVAPGADVASTAPRQRAIRHERFFRIIFSPCGFDGAEVPSLRRGVDTNTDPQCFYVYIALQTRSVARTRSSFHDPVIRRTNQRDLHTYEEGFSTGSRRG